MRARSWATAGLSVVVLVWGGLGYLATKPPDFHDYRTTAVSAARSAYGAVATARLIADARAGEKVTARYADAGLADARDGLAGAAGDVAGVNPPDDRSARLRDELDPLLRDAKAALDTIESAAGPAALRAAADDAAPVADGLSRFIAAHS